MKNKDIKILGLLPQTIEETFVNPLTLLSSDEFNRPTPKGLNYRERAVNRAFKAKVGFNSEVNTIGELVKKLNLTCKCPNSGKTIKFVYTGGNSYSATLVAKGEECEVTMHVPHDFLTFQVK